MAKRQTGLGRGFDALLPHDIDTSILKSSYERLQEISLKHIHPNPDQPRKKFDDNFIDELAASIKKHGVLQPIIITPKGDGYEIIAGERRWRAAQKAGLKTAPAIVRSLKELEKLEIALVENVQRVDLSPIEQAMSIERLHQQFSLSYEEISKKLGKAISTINNCVRLLQLPLSAQEALNKKIINEGHARQILALKSYSKKQSELLELIIKHGWSVRQAERFVTAFKNSSPGVESKELQNKIKSETKETKLLGKLLNARVSIRHTARGGKLEINYVSENELSRIIEFLLKR